MLAAEIITISDKLLTPFYSDTNTLWLVEQLNSIGIDVKLKTVLGNDEQRLTLTLKNALNRSQIILILVTSTENLLAYQVSASLLNRSLAINPLIQPQNNISLTNQPTPLGSDLPQIVSITDAQNLTNPEGSIPGIFISEKDKRVILLPNILSQLQPMYKEISPLLVQLAPTLYLRRRILKVVGMSESAIDRRIAPIYSLYQNLTTMILFFQNEVHIRLVASASSEYEAEELLNEVVSKIAAQLGKNLFTYKNETLEDVVANGLVSKGHTIALVENGSGGLLAMRLTNSSASDLCLKQANICSYSPQSHIKVIDKDGNLLSISELVSPTAAQALAVDAKQRTNATIGLSITGIIDSDYATAQLPVGLFFIGIADNTKSISQKLLLPSGDREHLRGLSSAIALDIIRRKYC
ncbi:MAG: competence/damage-inducible protein CinA [bacterium]|nr:MAG: competence/damage-inducible protein CinA [bacterium]